MLIQHARPRLKPPGYAVLRVRRDHPLAVGLAGCFVQGGQFGLGRDLVTGAAFTGTNTPTMNLTPDGPAVDYSGTALTSATSQPIWNVLGAITLAWRGIVRTPSVTGFLLGKIPAGAGGGTDTPFSLEYCNPTANRVSFVRSNTGGTPFRVWQSGSNLLTANALTSISVSQGADMSVAPVFYLDGAQDAAAPVSQYGGAGTGAATGNTSPVQFARRPDGAGQHAGQTTIAILASRQWSAKEHQQFGWAPYEVLEEAPTYHFLSGYVEPPPPEPSVTVTTSFQPHGVLRRRVRRQMWANVPEELKPVVALAEEWTEADPVRRAVDEALAAHARMTARTTALRRERLIDEARRAIIAAVERAAEMDDEEALIALL